MDEDVVWREAVVEPVPSPVRRTVWPEEDEVVEVVLLAVVVDLEPELAAGVVTLDADDVLVVAEEVVCLEAEEAVEEVVCLEAVEVVEVVVCREGVVAAEVVVVEEVVVREAEEVVCFCAEALNPKATRDRAAAAVATIIIILFIALQFFICKYNTFSKERGIFPRLSSKSR